MLIAVLMALLLTPQGAPGAELEHFFIGNTEGSGTVNIILSGKHWMRDRTRGWKDAQGALVLDQTVEEEGKAPRKRSWRLVRSGANQVSGTISDVKGQVAGEVSGRTLHLRYRLAEGPSVEQWITLQPGGRTATNRMSFRRFFVNVATVESTLRKID